MGKNGGKEYKHVEFIRNPEKGNEQIEERLQWMALDYFDYISIHEVSNFSECLDYQNDISCEAYQNIGIFREREIGGPEEGFTGVLPFVAVLQVTVMPEVYQEEMEDMPGSAMRELAEAVGSSKESFDSSCEMDYGVYYTVNNIDFCILIGTDRLDLAGHVSNKIKEILTEARRPKYSVYTTVGIDCQLQIDRHKQYMAEDTVLVTRISLNRNFYSKKILEKFSANLQGRSNDSITNTHALPGRYELSIRVEGKENFLQVLDPILRFNAAWLRGEEGKLQIAELSKEERTDREKKDSIFFLITNHCVKYINTRLFYNVEKTFTGIGSGTVKEDFVDRAGEYENLSNLVAELESLFQEEVDEYSRSIFMGYLEKLKRIIYTNRVLLDSDDTRVSMKMMGRYLEAFLQQLLLNARFMKENLIDRKVYAMNFLAGINYIQQYTKIVTSVNGNSFESPQFGTERDECTIGKLPVAYTEFLGNVFEKYYEHRTKETRRPNDTECQYFPEYYPLVVPYMYNGLSDFMMLTLLAQNVSDDWDRIKEGWKQHIEDGNRILMFIICQNMRQYKDVSALLAASFHELGHYCNCITRVERNTDLIAIYSEQVMKCIIMRWIGLTGTGYPAMQMAEVDSEIVTALSGAVFDALMEYFQEQLRDSLSYPEEVFNQNFKKTMNQLSDPYLNCSDDIARDILGDAFYDEARYRFDLEPVSDDGYFEESEEEREKKVFDDIKKQAMDSLGYLQSFVEQETVSGIAKEPGTEGDFLSAEDLDNEHVRGMVVGIKQYIEAFRSLWDKLSLVPRDEDEQETNELVDTIVEGVKITEFLREVYADQGEYGRQISFFQSVRKRLENVLQALHLAFQLCDRYNIGRFPTQEMQELMNRRGDLPERIDAKKMFIKNVYKKYRRRTDGRFGEMTMANHQYYEIYYKMHIMPDNGFEAGFARMLNEVLLGLHVPEAVLDLVRSCYKESLADIVMCANLELDEREYLAATKNFYNVRYETEAPQKVSRLVVVLSYLWFIRPEGKEWSEWDQDEIKQQFLDKIMTLRKKLSDERVVSEVIEMTAMIHNKFQSIMDGRWFEVVMNRVSALSPYLKFFDGQEEIAFIHDDLGDKLRNDMEKADTVQKQEIDFVLKYYYENRRKYS